MPLGPYLFWGGEPHFLWPPTTIQAPLEAWIPRSDVCFLGGLWAQRQDEPQSALPGSKPEQMLYVLPLALLLAGKPKGHKPRPFPGILDASEIHLQGWMLLSPTWPCLPLGTQWGTMPWKATLTSKELPWSRTNPTHSQWSWYLLGCDLRSIRNLPLASNKKLSYMGTWNSAIGGSFLYVRRPAPRGLLETANILRKGKSWLFVWMK